jgi:hypothetical protein
LFGELPEFRARDILLLADDNELPEIAQLEPFDNT